MSERCNHWPGQTRCETCRMSLPPAFPCGAGSHHEHEATKVQDDSGRWYCPTCDAHESAATPVADGIDAGDLPRPGVGFNRAPSAREREWESLMAERDKYHRQAQDTEKKLAAIATLVSIYDNQDEPEGQVSARRALTAIGETIGQPCSVCRSRHGSEVRHAAE